MLNYLLEAIIVGVSLVAIFEIIERVRIAVGREMLTDKILAFLEDVYHRTAPNDDHIEMDWQGCDLPDKVKVIYYNDEKKYINLSDDNFFGDNISELFHLKMNIETSVGESTPTEVEAYSPIYTSGRVQEVIKEEDKCLI